MVVGSKAEKIGWRFQHPAVAVESEVPMSRIPAAGAGVYGEVWRSGELDLARVYKAIAEIRDLRVPAMAP